MDDVDFFCNALEEHVEHLHIVLQKLRTEKIVAKRKNASSLKKNSSSGESFQLFFFDLAASVTFSSHNCAWEIIDSYAWDIISF